MERETRFELATLALARRCSTTELLPLVAELSIPGEPKAGQTAVEAEVDARRWRAAPHRGGSPSLRAQFPRRACIRIRPAMEAASGLCVIISVVWPSSRFDRSSIASTASEFLVSRLPVGSSASTMAGRVISARAMATRCCSPPLNSEGRCLRRPWIDNRSLR
jgi:hypothetical protein